MTRLTTRLLSRRTWPDYERLFTREGDGWSACGCMLWHRGHHLSRSAFPTKRARIEQNLHEKRELVGANRSHGILVYAEGEPVGWCQFGPKAELPLVDQPGDAEPTWRITCFVTRKDFRRRGVATVALRAAVAAVSRRGGGLIEAYPMDADVGWAYTGTVRLFAHEGFREVRRYPLHSERFPRYDRNSVTAQRDVVVMHLRVGPK